MAVTIRAYRPADVDALIALFRAAVRQVASRDYTAAQVRAWAPDVIDRAPWLERRASRPTFVAELDGRIAGFSDLEPDGHLDMMFVHPRFHRLGVATALVSHVEAQARRLGLPRIYAEVSLTARPFFQRQGFRYIADRTIEQDGLSFLTFDMEKKV